MTDFATLPGPDRRLVTEEVAARLDRSPLIVEKDFWVCWTLARIYSIPAIGNHVVFKGGTSLSKVFHVIERFSEDIDLSVMPTCLGRKEADLDDAPTPTQRHKRIEMLNEACSEHVRWNFGPVLEDSIRGILGQGPSREPWLRFETDALAKTPNLWFAYPSALSEPGIYVEKRIKLEFASLTRQRPVGRHSLKALLDGVVGESYGDLSAEAVVLDLEKTFWEKATILHAEYHRPLEKPVPDRSSRHYSDFAALWRDPRRAAALSRTELLQDVVDHKTTYFQSKWASYNSARLGTFKLVPRIERHDALRRDYANMRPMFPLRPEPPPFGEMMRQLEAAEKEINAP